MFDQVKTRVLLVSTDDRKGAREVWNQVVSRGFTVLSDPGAQVIRKYGLLHPHGGGGEDIALDTSLLVDEKGVERWRLVSQTLPDLPKAAEIVQRIRDAFAARPR